MGARPELVSRDRSDDASRDETGLAGLYAREAPRLLRFFRHRIGRADESADMVQESFLRLVGAPAAASLQNPAAYLNRVARNLLYDRTRAKRRRGAVVVDEPAEQFEIAVAPDQCDRLEADELMDRYQRAVDALPPRTREVFLLHRADGLTCRDIATRLGIGVRTVEWHIAEALVRIRKMLDED